MSLEENKALVTRYIEEVWGKTDMDVVVELVAPDYHRHQPNAFLDVENILHLTQLILVYSGGIPDLELRIEHMLAEGDYVFVRVHYTGTHTGPLANIPPTNEKIDVTSSDLYRLAGGQIAESWHNLDDWGFMAQIGVLGPPE